MQTIQAKVEVTLNDCVQMMRHNPATRFGYWLLVLSFPLPGIFGYYLARDAIVESATSAKHLAKLNNDYILLTIIISIAWLALIIFSWRFVEKYLGSTMYETHKKKNAMFLNILFDKDSRKFIFNGRDKEKYKNNPKIKIIATPDNYIFYLGRGLYPGKLFLPKNRVESQTLITQEIIRILDKEENISIKHKKK
ncbi:hypothetical protein [Sutcliffiella deserti]|uniref:hypothetical protein n=1 Tax=Sutcliffiella deserti TaxID=2875501 RepID=UPI001CC09A0E|nr:hypothetical protein [Sutcliffiella deserti]